jgi:expansin (peptidoglycan-binding protein)
VRVKEGSSQYWLAVLVGNTGNRLRSVAVRFGSAWRPLERQDYNYWLAPQGAGEGPFTLRVQDVEGHVAVVPGVRLSPGAVQRTNVRLY